ncbi:hypothetical protein L6452_00728 [Arctium lappa]|uniref:Uncharacterized protein n=1 Tax=Arctium lappa TaxID=4217 RepID=A0ACB9FEA8_ARCLA|nr:hypothetical protein L6452_00728 [Arctium lappa]
MNQRRNFQRPTKKTFGYRKKEKNHVDKKTVKSKSHMKKHNMEDSVKMWIPKSTKTVSTATANSASDSNSSARSNTAASNVSVADIVCTSANVTTANFVSTANKVNTAKPVSVANSVSTSKDSIASSISAARPIILTKYSNNKHMTGNMSCLKNFKKIDGGHVAFGNTPDGGKISGKGDVTKGIERQYSAPRTPQQNGVAERRNRTLIEVARSLLADSKLPITFWAETVNTACYVQNRVLVVKPKNKTPYELLNKRKPFIGFFKPFGCPCTILNTKSHLGKFDSKADDGFLVGYSSQSKAYRVFNTSSRIIEESDNVKCNENTPNPIGSGPQWLFDIDSLTNSFGFSSDGYAGSGSGGSGATQVQDNIPQFVIFPIRDSERSAKSKKQRKQRRFALHVGGANQGFRSAAPRPVGLRGLGVKHPLELTLPDQKGYIDIS